MSLSIRIAKNCAPTAQILGELLLQRGVQTTFGPSPTAEATLSWGVPLGSSAKNTLNTHAGGSDKLAQLESLTKAGLTTVPFTRSAESARYPCLARKRQHRGGFDIRFCRTPRRAALMLKRGWHFLSPVVPSVAEFRVWVFRSAHLGSYEKVLVRPQDQFNKYGKKRFGRNYRNGYAFQLVKSEKISRPAVELAVSAIAALKLDFGAVDILMGIDGKPRILEVNTAPGVEGDGRQVIRALADKVASWVKKGYPPRKLDA